MKLNMICIIFHQEVIKKRKLWTWGFLGLKTYVFLKTFQACFEGKGQLTLLLPFVCIKS